MMVYIFATFCGCSLSLSKVQFCCSTSKRSPKKPRQKSVKCCMKAPIRQGFLQTSLFIVKDTLKSQLQTDAFISLLKSLSSVPSTSSLSIVACQRSLQQGFWLTLLLCSRECLMKIFKYFLLCRIVIPKVLWNWPKADFF